MCRRLLLALLLLIPLRAFAAQPNIILIVADDLSTKAVSSYCSGACSSGDGVQKYASTPNIDSIASGGVRFSQAYAVTALCTPSRQAMYTGLYPWNSGVYGNRDAVAAGVTTLATTMHSHGYETEILGKWQTPETSGTSMQYPGTGQGWDYRWLCYTAGCSEYTQNLRMTLNCDPGNCPNPSDAFPTHSPDNNVTDVLTDKAITRMDAMVTMAVPWMLVIAHKAPHTPSVPSCPESSDPTSLGCSTPTSYYQNLSFGDPASLLDTWAGRAVHIAHWPNTLLDLYSVWTQTPYKGTGAGEYNKAQPAGGLTTTQKKQFMAQAYARDYIATVASLDRNVGLILSYLTTKADTRGGYGTHLSDNTVVCFISDNGVHVGENGFYEKYRPYDVDDHIPLMCGPSSLIGFSAGTVKSDLVLNLDIPETFVALSGFAAPAAMQGRSLLDLQGTPSPAWRTGFLYHSVPLTEVGGEDANNVQRHLAYITVDWKLIQHIRKTADAGPEWELIDRNADPNELTNVYNVSANKTILATLKAAMQADRVTYGIPNYMNISLGTRAGGRLP